MKKTIYVKKVVYELVEIEVDDEELLDDIVTDLDITFEENEDNAEIRADKLIERELRQSSYGYKILGYREGIKEYLETGIDEY